MRESFRIASWSSLCVRFFSLSCLRRRRRRRRRFATKYTFIWNIVSVLTIRKKKRKIEKQQQQSTKRHTTKNNCSINKSKRVFERTILLSKLWYANVIYIYISLCACWRSRVHAPGKHSKSSSSSDGGKFKWSKLIDILGTRNRSQCLFSHYNMMGDTHFVPFDYFIIHNFFSLPPVFMECVTFYRHQMGNNFAGSFALWMIYLVHSFSLITLNTLHLTWAQRKWSAFLSHIVRFGFVLARTFALVPFPFVHTIKSTNWMNVFEMSPYDYNDGHFYADSSESIHLPFQATQNNLIYRWLRAREKTENKPMSSLCVVAQ